MEGPSFVSKARTAFHSAAARAERVFTDLKSDRDSDRQPPKSEEAWKRQDDQDLKPWRWTPAYIGPKPDWQDRFKNIRIGKKGAEDQERVEKPTMSVPFYDENVYILKMKQDLEAKASDVGAMVERLTAIDENSIPPASTLKQLAVAVEAGKRVKSMKDFITTSGNSSPVRERGALSLSAVKSLVLRDKEDKVGFEPGDEDKLVKLVNSLFDTDGSFLSRKTCSNLDRPGTVASLLKDLHGSPPESFVVKLAEIIGGFTTPRRMALFWCRVVAELRRFWSEEKHIPGIPLDESPDLNSCLLYQWLQVINCCLSRKARVSNASESLDSVIRQASSTDEVTDGSAGTTSSTPLFYARTATGELILRLGADHQVDNLAMLETGEPVYAPVTQEGPLLTEDFIRETEELVLRTGSVGAGCSQLLSDMQAFKAANPGCTLEDFVRWHSPPDWTENETCSEDNDMFSAKGQLSNRMQKEGNLWRELWETAKPVPAVKQAPLYDEDLAVEGILNSLEDISAAELFEQLSVSLLGLGLVLSEARLATNDDLSKLFNECKDYVVATRQGGSWSEKLDELCQVYETVEMMLVRPDDVLKSIQQTEDSLTVDEPKGRFKRLSLVFGSKDKHLKKPAPEDPKGSELSTGRQPFSSFFDGKSSLFSKKPPKPELASPAVKSSCLDETGGSFL